MSTSPRLWRLHVRWPSATIVGWWIFSQCVCLSGVAFGRAFLTRQLPEHSHGFSGAMIGVDGIFYEQIARECYTYAPASRSNVAFFTGYPLVAVYVHSVTALDWPVPMLLVSNVCWIIAHCTFADYLSAEHRPFPENVTWSVVAFAIWPTTCFCRMGYADSLYLFWLGVLSR